MFWQIQSCSIFKNARINIVWGEPSSLFWWSFFQSLDFTLVSFSTSVYGLQKIAKGDGSKLAVTKHKRIYGGVSGVAGLFWCPSEKCWPLGWVLSSCPPCSTHPFPFLSPSCPCPFNPFSLSGGNRFQGGLCTHLNHLSPGLKVLPRRCCVPLSRVGRWQTHSQGAVGYVWLRASKRGLDWLRIRTWAVAGRPLCSNSSPSSVWQWRTPPDFSLPRWSSSPEITHPVLAEQAFLAPQHRDCEGLGTHSQPMGSCKHCFFSGGFSATLILPFLVSKAHSS